MITINIIDFAAMLVISSANDNTLLEFTRKTMLRQFKVIRRVCKFSVFHYIAQTVQSTDHVRCLSCTYSAGEYRYFKPLTEGKCLA